MKKKLERLRHLFDCYVRNVHIYDLGTNPDRWKSEDILKQEDEECTKT